MKINDDWTAIHDHMPGHDLTLTVSGTLLCHTDGWVGTLHELPSGVNPKILLMELVMRPAIKGGNPVETTVTVSWSEATDFEYDQVTISVEDEEAEDFTLDVQHPR